MAASRLVVNVGGLWQPTDANGTKPFAGIRVAVFASLVFAALVFASPAYGPHPHPFSQSWEKGVCCLLGRCLTYASTLRIASVACGVVKREIDCANFNCATAFDCWPKAVYNRD